MGFRFDETMRGRKFYDADLPRLIKAIEANTAEMKRANDLKEAELTHKGVLDDGKPLQTDRHGIHDSRD